MEDEAQVFIRLWRVSVELTTVANKQQLYQVIVFGCAGC